MERERVFIGCSSEAEETARALGAEMQLQLPDLEPVLWTDTIWKNLEAALSNLSTAIANFDYAIFLAYPDDGLCHRGEELDQTRDNVIFEFGLFLTALGRERTFLVRPDNHTMRVLSDVGHSLYCPEYHYTKDKAGTINIDIASLKKATSNVCQNITDLRKKRDAENSTTIASAHLTKAIATFYDEVETASNDNLSDYWFEKMVSREIAPLTRLKSKSSGRTISDIVYDLGRYFDLVDDILDVGQLSDQQKFDCFPSRRLEEVWIFADSPIELHRSDNNRLEAQFEKLRSTVARNIRNNVKYSYIGSPKFPEDALRSRLEAEGLSEELMLSSVDVTKVAGTLFKTFFTIHKYRDSSCDVFMSLLAKNRDDLLIKVRGDQAGRIVERLEVLKGRCSDTHGFWTRDYVTVRD